jgi:hypothetical protein
MGVLVDFDQMGGYYCDEYLVKTGNIGISRRQICFDEYFEISQRLHLDFKKLQIIPNS